MPPPLAPCFVVGGLAGSCSISRRQDFVRGHLLTRLDGRFVGRLLLELVEDLLGRCLNVWQLVRRLLEQYLRRKLLEALKGLLDFVDPLLSIARTDRPTVVSAVLGYAVSRDRSKDN